jgi:hypothetical protein
MKDKNNKTLAPVVLFVYNRPEHTTQTLNALMANELAPQTLLYIYSDGPKDDASNEIHKNINEVRKIIHEKRWCGEVKISESSINLGLGTSVKNGVSEVIKKHGRVIVLEDDLVTSPVFLNYMNDALDYYENRKGVFSISGYCLPPNKFKVPDNYSYDVFASLRNSSWGWGTWVDRWEQVDWEMNNFKTIADDPFIKEAINRGGDDVFQLLEVRHIGKLDIWSIQFTLAHFANHAVSIVPTFSYVNNIGLDGTGMNCGTNVSFSNIILCNTENIRFLDVLYEDRRIINSFYNVYCNKKRPLWQKLINRMSQIVRKKRVFSIKKKIYC